MREGINGLLYEIIITIIINKYPLSSLYHVPYTKLSPGCCGEEGH